MKKRLSLLMVLMMIVSLLPMSAFAASTPGYTTLLLEEDDVKTVTVGFVVPAGVTLGSGELRFTLDNGATLEDPFTAASKLSIVKPASETTLAVNTPLTRVNDQLAYGSITGATNPAGNGDTQVQLTLANVEFPNLGDVFLTVEDVGNVGIGNQTIKIAIVKSADTANLAMTVKDAEKSMSFDGGTLSQFEIKNIKTDTNQIVLEADAGFVWNITAADVSILGSAGNSVVNVNNTGNKSTITLTNKLVAADKNAALIVTPKFGGVGRKASEGNVTVYVEAFDYTAGPPVVSVSKGTNRDIIGKLVDYNVTMTVVEKGKKAIPNVWGGEEATVKVTLKGPKGSLLDRAIDFKVDGSDVVYGDGTKLVSDPLAQPIKAGSSKPSGVTLVTDATPKSNTSTDTVIKDKEFTLTSTGSKFDTLEELSFEMVIRTDGDKDGVATITAMQRGLEVTADLAKITPKFTAKADVTPVKKGEARDTADVTITEAKAGLLEKGERITLSFDTKRDYVDFTSKSLKVEATNGMKFDTTQTKWFIDGTKDNEIGVSLLIDKASYGDAAVITISDVNVSVDGSTTDDVVKLYTGLASKKAVAAANGDRTKGTDVSVIDYVKVVKEYDFESILSVFTIGQTAYTVNGEAKAAHSAPYIKAGRTMLPIRAVAESLGLEVQWNSATRTASFTDANKVAAVTIGSKVLYVNGTPMPLTVPAELVNDTTFVELRSLATAFGVQIDWDAAAKTATVSK